MKALGTGPGMRWPPTYQPKSDGLQPKSDGLQPSSDGLQVVIKLWQLWATSQPSRSRRHRTEGFGWFYTGGSVFLGVPSTEISRTVVTPQFAANVDS